MKKVITGLTALTFLAACGGLNSVEPEQNTTSAGEAEEAGTAVNESQQNESESSEENGEVSTGENAAENSADENTGEEAEADEETSSDETASGVNAEDVTEFDLHIEFQDDTEWEYELERDDLDDTEVDRDGEESLSGEAALEEIEGILSEMTINTDRPLEDMIQEALEATGASADEVDDVDLEIKFSDGEEITIDHEGRQQAADYGAVREFDLDIDFFNGEDLEYDYEADDPEGEIERRDGSEAEGAAAIQEIEALLENITISMDRSISDMKEEVLSELDIAEDEVEDFDIEVEYENGETVKFKHDVE
ncbi:YusW family protein [Alkalicoccus saliphilus]|uniref:YusW-like protein n=1 Tax=Alkalicoccus saliphilus TaxID=200989 RepID=A0A2T4U495_9BACI|nr:YusW family protein [Alkalicoccus saliphilus]PTL38228.1 hypothetical protein C6Y45_12555 [Alkalicoccus saliphilus]